MTPIKASLLAASALGIGGTGFLGIHKTFKTPLIKEKMQSEKLQMRSEEELQQVISSSQSSNEGQPNKQTQLNDFIKRHKETTEETVTADKNNLKAACQNAQEKSATEKEWSDFNEFCTKKETDKKWT